MTKYEYAISLHNRGCNCAQSVACAFAKELNTDEKLLMRIIEGFGRGCGGMQGVCGALSGALALAGLKYADGNIEAPKTKETTYKAADMACREFSAKCGSLICEELKGISSGKPLISCPECIEMGVILADKIINGKFEE